MRWPVHGIGVLWEAFSTAHQDAEIDRVYRPPA
jgi:hypothetical protein